MPAPLDLVLRNLVDNAIKHSAKEAARIDIACTADMRSIRLSIADDGPGIPPAYHEAVFKPFQRLDGASETDGSGIGLALVRKTVETCGATLTLMSDPGSRSGTTFVIDWPCKILS